VNEERTTRAIVTDVTLREYGQNVPARFLTIFTPEIRYEITQRLIGAGFRDIEILSCVHPAIAPAMNKDALKKISEKLGRIDGVNLTTLVPNRAGYEAFLDLNLGPDGHNHSMGIFFSAVEAHNLVNLGRPIKDTLDEYRMILNDSASQGIRVIAYISAAFGYLDPEKGALTIPDTGALNSYIDLLFGLGADLVTLSDLQGVANEEGTGEILEGIFKGRKWRDIERLGYHPHHVSGDQAIANSKIAYDLGIRRFDSSLGGTGGCVTGAPGNQPTEGLIHFLHSHGIETNIDEEEVFSLAEMVQRELYSRIKLSETR
jgi:hydroxymethylglutaryl-CoA lyase